MEFAILKIHIKIKPIVVKIHSIAQNTQMFLFTTWAIMTTCTRTRCALRGGVSMNDTTAAQCNDLGIQFLEINNLSDAEAMFKSAIVYKHDYVAAHTNLALTLILEEEYGYAKEVLQKAYFLDPTNLHVHFYFGMVHAAFQNLTLAVESFEHARCIDPSFKPATIRVGIVYLVLNETSTAVQTLQTAADDSASGSYVKTGLYFLKLGDLEKAHWSFLQALWMHSNASF